MFCHKCGRELEDNAVRCPFCNADTSAYLKDDDSSLREILRLSEELNEEGADNCKPDDKNGDGSSSDAEAQPAEAEENETKEAFVPSASEENGDSQSSGFTQEEKTSEEKANYADSGDGFYIPKRAAVKAGLLPEDEAADEEETAAFETVADDNQNMDDGIEESSETFENAQDDEEAYFSGDDEIETIDAGEEEPAEEEFNEEEAFFSSYIPINEIDYEEEEPEEPIDRDIDYEDGFMDDGYYGQYNDNNVQYEDYGEEEDEEKPPKKPIPKKWIIIPIVLIALGAATWFGLSEFVIDSAAAEAVTAFSEQKYDTAAKIYNEEVKTSPIQMWLFESKMNSYIDGVLDAHREKTLSYEEAKKALNSVVALDDDRFSQKAKDSLASIEALEVSREAYTAGQEYFSNGDYIAAAEEFSKVIESDPDYSKAMTSKDAAYAKYKEKILADTDGCETSDDYRSAIELLNEAVKQLPDDKDILARLDECTEGLQNAIIAEAISEIEGLINNGKYDEALELIDQNLEKYPSNSDILALKDTCIESYVAFAKSQALSLLNSEKYMDAISLIDSMLDKFPENESLLSYREECVSVYVNAAVSQADELLNAENFDDALEVIEKALSDLSGNATLLNKKQEIIKAMPVSLIDECPPYETTNYKLFTNSSTSSFKIDGKTYKEGFTLYSSNGWFASGNGVAKIKLDGLYSKLKFSVGKIDGGRNVNGILNIYVDDELVDTLTINSEGGLQSFEVSLNHGQELKFELLPESGNSTPSFGFTNLALYK